MLKTKRERERERDTERERERERERGREREGERGTTYSHLKYKINFQFWVSYVTLNLHLTQQGHA